MTGSGNAMTELRRDLWASLPCPACAGRELLDGEVCGACGGTGRVGPEELMAILTDELREEEGDDATVL
jgi:hypothetical protein